MKKTAIYKILEAIRENPRRGFPVFIGPTQYGKTFTAYDYAAAIQRPLVPVNLQVETEEEIGGYPIHNKRTNEVLYSMPPFLTTALKAAKVTLDEPFVLFLDEIDKARSDLLSCILTLTSTLERRLRHTRLHDGVLMLGAMNQPERPLPDTLLARMLMLPFPWGEEYYETFPKRLQGALKKHYPLPTIQFPDRPKSPGSRIQLEEWVTCIDFWKDEEIRALVVRGLFRAQDVPAILEELELEKPIDEKSLVEWVNKASVQSLLKNLIGYLSKAAKVNVQVEYEMLEAFLARAKEDKTGEIELLYSILMDLNFPVPASSVNMEEEVQKQGQEALANEYAKRLLEMGKKVKKPDDD